MKDRNNWDVFKFEHLARIRQRAKKRKLAFNLTIEDFVYPETCPILQIPISRTLSHNHNPSVDRLDNNFGYVKGNVRIISNRANSLKNDLDLGTAKRLVAYMSGEL